MTVSEYENKRRVAWRICGILGAVALVFAGSCAPTKNDPIAQPTTVPDPLPEVVIDVAKDGSTLVDGKKLNDVELTEVLAARMQVRPDQTVTIRIYESCVLKYYAHVGSICMNAHVNNPKLVYLIDKSE